MGRYQRPCWSCTCAVARDILLHNEPLYEHIMPSHTLMFFLGRVTRHKTLCSTFPLVSPRAGCLVSGQCLVLFSYFVVSVLPSSVWEAYHTRHSSGLAGVAPVFGLFVLSVSVLPICIIICLALLPWQNTITLVFSTCHRIHCFLPATCVSFLEGLIDVRRGCSFLVAVNLL